MLLHAVMKYTIRPNLEFFSKSFWAMCFLKLTVKLYCYELNLESFHLPIALQQGLAKTFCRLLLLFFFFGIMSVPWSLQKSHCDVQMSKDSSFSDEWSYMHAQMALRNWIKKQKEGMMSSDKMYWLHTACAQFYLGCLSRLLGLEGLNGHSCLVEIKIWWMVHHTK